MKEPTKKSSSYWWLFLVIPASLFVLGILVLPFVFFFSSDIETGNVAVIKLRGVIMEDGNGFSGDVVSAADVVGFITDAEEDSSIKAIVIDINSPGGSAVASDEIAEAVKQSSKPTVAFIHEIGTSGAYWVASATDTVIAHEMSITGSIGVLSSYLELSGLMEKYGVSYERLVAGKYKDMGTPFKELTQEERKLLQQKLDKIHDVFITEVADNRGLSKAQVKSIATGEFFLGDEAQKYGLIDIMGGQKELEQHLNSLGITTIEYVHYAQEATLLDVLNQLGSSFFFSVGQGIGTEIKEQPLIVT